MKQYRHTPTGEIFKETVALEDNKGRLFPIDWCEDNPYWEPVAAPTRPVVCTLQGKDMHEGDTMWIVDHFWNVCVTTIVPEPAVNYKNRFKSRELANDFVRENKPVYPAAEFEKLKELSSKVANGYNCGTVFYNEYVADMRNLKTYLESLNKKP